jgi:hypothetical protein
MLCIRTLVSLLMFALIFFTYLCVSKEYNAISYTVISDTIQYRGYDCTQ